MKFFARLRSRKKTRGSILFRYGWKITLLILLAGACFAVFLFYGTWAQTFDMKNVGEMPERSTVTTSMEKFTAAWPARTGSRFP